jgi:hypothetical protein
MTAQAQALQSIRDQIKQELANAKNTFEKPGVPRIKTTGKRFALPSGQASPDPIRLIILDYRNTRSYYVGIYNQNNPKPPVCFAMGSDINVLAPDPSAPDAQSELCATCEKNEWGSDPNGGPGKACKSGVRLAVVAPDFDPETAEPMALDIAPKGLSSWGTLLQTLTAAGQHVAGVVTEVSFAPEFTYPALRFQAVETHDRLEAAWALREKAQIMLAEHPNAR